MKNLGRGRVSLTKAQRQSAAGAELLALCQTVTEDGTISEGEVAALREWLDENAAADLPAQKFLAETVERIIADGKVTSEERDELFHAVEAVLPPDVRESARSKHRSLDAAERLAAREERDRQRPVGTWDFMVAGVSHEGRAAIVEQYAEVGQRAFVVRDRANRFSRNAVEVRLENGMCVGYVPEEYAVEMAPDLDGGCLHTAVVKKILGRRNIPVIVATLYRPEAEVPGLVAETAVPKTAVPAGCFGAAALLVVSFVSLAALALGCGSTEPAPSLTGQWVGGNGNLIVSMTLTEGARGGVVGEAVARYCTSWLPNCAPYTYAVTGTHSAAAVTLVLRLADLDSTTFAGWLDTPNALTGTLDYLLGYRSQVVAFTRAPSASAAPTAPSPPH
jgi:hypothetical protein